MTTSEEPQLKKVKLSEENQVKECSMTGICLNNFITEKSKWLLPTVYPLNGSRCKNLTCGLKLNYLTQEVEPVIGIIDQYYNGVTLSEESWKSLTECFGQVEEFFTCANTKKWNECLHKPITHPGFTLSFDYITCGYSKSKVMRLEQKENPIHEADRTNSKGMSATMQYNTFSVLRDSVPIITEYLIFLHSMIPCVKVCINSMIEFGKFDVGKQNVNNFLKEMHGEVVKHIGRKSLNKSECMNEVVRKIGEMEDDMYDMNCKRIINELYVFHSDFLIYYMYN